jgi:hypothetical protein
MERSCMLANGDEVLRGGEIRSVVYDRSYTAEKILVNAPAYPQLTGNSQYPCNSLFIGSMDIAAPFGVTAIYPVAEPGEKVEIEMIVGVDQPGEGNDVFKRKGNFVCSGWNSLTGCGRG